VNKCNTNEPFSLHSYLVDYQRQLCAFGYSGGVLANGRVVVDNGHTQYYGGVLQGFSKIGATLRVGLNAAKFN